MSSLTVSHGGHPFGARIGPRRLGGIGVITDSGAETADARATRTASPQRDVGLCRWLALLRGDDEAMVPVARKNLFAEKGRFAMSVGGVAFAVLLILIVVSLYRGWSSTGSIYVRLPGRSG
jgi:hypothetical protein